MPSLIGKFLADRGTHLAAMVAYSALLSFVPLVFLATAVLGLLGEQTASSFLIDQLQRTFPAASVNDILAVVDELQRQAGLLTAVGAVGLLWGSLGLLSTLESALNIVYGVANRRFLRGKALALGLVALGLATVFVALFVGSLGVSAARGGGLGSWAAYAAGIAISTVLVLLFTWTAYTLVTNVKLAWRATLPGALAATVALEGSFQLVPVFVRATGHIVALQVFGGTLVLLYWLFTMANVVVLGAELNWWLANRKPGEELLPISWIRRLR